MARLKGFKELTPITQAIDGFLETLRPKKLDTVLVPVEEALGRVTAKRIVARKSLPPFDRSAMDGYALKAKYTVNATQYQPKTVRLVHKEVVAEGEAKEVWTGNRLPNGADAVIMLEHTERKGDEIKILTSLAPGTNVSRKGEDLRKDETAVAENVRLKPHHLGLIAALEIKEVEVTRKPKVAILATGNELASLSDGLKPDQTVEINSIILSGMCTELGAEAHSLGIARDDEGEIEKKTLEGLVKADILLTTGGTSVGAHDLVPKVIERIEPRGIVVHGVAMRPGMPTALAVVHGKPVIILSGNPVAAAVGFEVFARPLIQKLLGVEREERARLRARLTRRVAGVLGRRVFLRVKVVEKGGELLAEPLRIKGSGVLTTMTKANGYVVIPENREGLIENEMVTVYLFDTVRGE